MKRLFPLLILVILVVSLPSVYAYNEYLYCDSYTGDLANWDERNEPSPYLADEDTGFIRETKTSGATEGYFGFENPVGTGIINSVTLYLECRGDDTNDQINIYVDCSDGSGWVNEGTITVDQTDYGLEILSLTSRLDSWPDIQNAQIYLSYQAIGGGDDIYVRIAYLYVDYTPSGNEYLREASQSISWSGVGYRTWDATKSFSRPLTLSSDSSRTLDLSRTFTQSITVASSVLADIIHNILVQVSQGIGISADSVRNWDLSRTLTQAVLLTSNTEKIAQFIRNPVQGIATSIEALRSWTMTRTFSLPMTFTSNAIADIFKNFQRTLTMALQLSSDSLREGALSRWASQSIIMTSENFRSWSLSRSFTQGLSFASSVWAQLSQGAEQFFRTLTLSMSLSTESLRFSNLSRIFEQGISLTSLATRSSSLIRTATQSLTAIIESNRIFSGIRQTSQNIAISSGAERVGTFIRGLSQPLTLTSDSLRRWNIKRSFEQGLSIISSIFTDFTEYFPSAEEFFRSVSIGIEIASSNIRQLNMKRGLSQVIAFAGSRGPQALQRIVTLSVTMWKEAARSIETVISPSYGIIPSQTTPTDNPPAFVINTNLLNLGIVIVIGSVSLMMFLKNYKAKVPSDVKKFKDRRDKKPGAEKDVPEEFKKRRK